MLGNYRMAAQLVACRVVLSSIQLLSGSKFLMFKIHSPRTCPFLIRGIYFLKCIGLWFQEIHLSFFRTSVIHIDLLKSKVTKLSNIFLFISKLRSPGDKSPETQWFWLNFLGSQRLQTQIAKLALSFLCSRSYSATQSQLSFWFWVRSEAKLNTYRDANFDLLCVPNLSFIE
jgi:hypothetical protein